MKKLIVIICLLFLVSCTKRNSLNMNKDKTFLGTITDESGEMVLLLNTETYITTVNPLYKDELIHTAKNEISKYHKLFDGHHYYLDDNGERITNIKVLNENIDNGPIKVDPILIDALNESIKLMKLTHGYFNITLGELSELYQEKFLSYDSTNVDPEKRKIEEKVNSIVTVDSIDEQIIIDRKNNTVELKSINGKFKLDLGAFSKGYIIDKVYKELIKFNSSFLLTAGSSSIVTFSTAEENISWNIGIKNPEKIDDHLFSFSINNGAISSSGDYENYYLLDDGTRRHHILNPHTGYSENYYRSNTLLSNNAYVIDALSTALFNVESKEERIEIINDVENEYDITISYCFIKDNEGVFMNSSFNNVINDSSSSGSIQNIEIE